MVNAIKQWMRNSHGIIKRIYLFFVKFFRGIFYRNMLTRIPHRLGIKNSKDKIFIISIDNSIGGIAPIIIYVLAYLKYAEKRKYIPVIDLKYYLSIWTGSDVDVNAWEYYFVQPTKISVAEAYRSKKVYFANPNPSDLSELYFDEELYENEYAIKCYHTYFRKYCHYKEDLRQYIEDEKKKILKKGRRILGCSIRMGYVQLQKSNHPVYNHHNIQPNSLDVFVEDLKKYLNKWNCDYIFLSTDDGGAVEYLKGFFGDKLLCLERERVNRTKNNQVIDMKDMPSVSRAVSAVIAGNYAYIAELEILSKCQCYLCGKNGGSMLVHILNNNKFEHTRVYQLGRFEYNKNNH